MAGILVPFGFFLCVFGIVYLVLTTRNRERMAMIEKGIDLSTLKSVPSRKYWVLKVGMLLVGIAIGILVGVLLDKMTSIPEEAAMFSMILLFGGSSLIFFYFLQRKMKAKEDGANL